MILTFNLFSFLPSKSNPLTLMHKYISSVDHCQPFFFEQVKLLTIQTHLRVLEVVVPAEWVPEGQPVHSQRVQPVLLLLEHLLRKFHRPPVHPSQLDQGRQDTQQQVQTGLPQHHTNPSNECQHQR